jgi:hypothetical protein
VDHQSRFGNRASPRPRYVKQEVEHRNPSPFLWLGIIFAPFIFGWTLLGRQYSTVSRALGLGWTVIATVVVAAASMSGNNQQVDNALAQQARHTPPAVRKPVVARADRTWQSSFDGHVVECVIPADGGFYYIVMPDMDQMQAGVQPMANLAPSEDSWSLACGNHSD